MFPGRWSLHRKITVLIVYFLPNILVVLLYVSVTITIRKKSFIKIYLFTYSFNTILQERSLSHLYRSIRAQTEKICTPFFIRKELE